jgi:hypothetical protein
MSETSSKQSFSEQTAQGDQEDSQRREGYVTVNSAHCFSQEDARTN